MPATAAVVFRPSAPISIERCVTSPYRNVNAPCGGNADVCGDPVVNGADGDDDDSTDRSSDPHATTAASAGNTAAMIQQRRMYI